MKLFLSAFALILLFASCDPGYSVVVTNRTGKTKNIKYFDKGRNYRDSVDTWPAGEDYYSTGATLIKVPVQKDSANTAISVMLDDQKSVVLERGMGGANPNAVMVVDGKDTLHVQTDKRVKKIRHTIAGHSLQINLP